MASPIVPNPLLGVGMHSVGAVAAANCYAPQKYLKQWSWEIYWMIQAAWCWLLWPIIGAVCTIPHLWQVLTDAPKERMLYSFLLGIAYGVGGTAFNISTKCFRLASSKSSEGLISRPEYFHTRDQLSWSDAQYHFRW